VLYISYPGENIMRKYGWLRNDKLIMSKVIEIDGINDEDTSETSWTNLTQYLPEILEFLDQSVQVFI
jgi:hypothetical protein